VSRRLALPLDKQCQLAGLPRPVTEFKFHPSRRWRFDYCWPDRSFAVEVDGAVFVQGRHTRGVGVERDNEKFAEALIAGWKVLRVSTNQVKDGRALGWIERLLR
jgi:very-short-patch-repair endonuclease